MRAMASQITSLAIVYSTAYSGTDQRKYQSSASLASVRWIPRTKGQYRGKCFHLITSSWSHSSWWVSHTVYLCTLTRVFTSLIHRGNAKLSTPRQSRCCYWSSLHQILMRFLLMLYSQRSCSTTEIDLVVEIRYQIGLYIVFVPCD